MDKKNKVLICSKDLVLSLKLKLFLEEKGLHVLNPVSSGNELIESALNFYPSLIITDITLRGEIDGIESISRISGITKIPYIFIADNTEQTSLIKSYFLYPLKVLNKPVDPDELYFFINDSIGYSNEAQHSNYFLG